MKQTDVEELAGVGERIGGLVFEPLSIRRRAQFASALTELLGEDNTTLFVFPLSLAASIASTGVQAEIDARHLRVQFDQLVSQHLDQILALLSEYSGHPAEKLENLRPSEIRRVFEVLLDLPT